MSRRHLPALGGATGWLNTEPLGPAELRGHVIVVNFWTLTCINWLRQEPYVRAWSRGYRDDGLVVVGVHTPEFSFEHEIDRVRLATKERDIDYPVAVDSDYVIWSAFDNHYWPALYFVDADGAIRDQHFGEGHYEQSERTIQRLLGVNRDLVRVDGVGAEAAADWDHLGTPESYLGYARSEQFASPERRRGPTAAAPTRSPTGYAPTSGHWPASGRSGRRTSCSTGPAAASPTDSTPATHTSCSRAGRASRSRSAFCSTAPLPARHTAWTSTSKATACSMTDGSTNSSGRPAMIRDRTVQITFRDPGAEAYAFTFG